MLYGLMHCSPVAMLLLLYIWCKSEHSVAGIAESVLDNKDERWKNSLVINWRMLLSLRKVGQYSDGLFQTDKKEISSMGDIKLFRISENHVSELEGVSVQLEKSLQLLIEKHLDSILAVRFLASEYSTGKTHGGRIDTLGIDENNSPVIRS